MLDVSSAGPGRVERGDLLRVVGSGFPSGRTGRLRLEGLLRRPTESEHAVDLTLAARAVSPERAEARVDEALFTRLGGGGTFRGRIELEFDAVVADAEPVSGAHEDVVVLFVAPTAARLSTELGHARAATELLAFLGAKPSADADADGVRVERVDVGGRAAVAGLRAGDVVVEVGGAIVTSLGDLAPPRGARTLQWRVARAGESTSLPISLGLRGLGGAPDPEWSWAAGLVALVWLAVLLGLAPTARFLGAAHRRLRTAARAQPSRGDVLVAVGAGLLASLVAAVPRLPSAIDVVAVFGALFALRLVLAVRGGPTDRRSRLTRALTLEVAAGLALAALAAHAGTTRFAGLAAAQALAPATLGVLSGPVPLVAALVWLRVACVPTAEVEGRALALVDGESLRRALAAALLALVAFGGATSTATGAHYPLGALVVGPVASVLSLASSRFRGLGRPRGREVVAVAAFALVGASLLAAWPLAVAVEAMLAKGSAALVVGTLLVAAVSLWWQPRSARLRGVELR